MRDGNKNSNRKRLVNANIFSQVSAPVTSVCNLPINVITCLICITVNSDELKLLGAAIANYVGLFSFRNSLIDSSDCGLS